MLKRFQLSNYKNFKDSLSINFDDVGGYQFNTDCLSDNIISKMLVYGRNATGKTNLGSAIIDIATSSWYLMYNDSPAFLNADSIEDAVKFSYVFKFGNEEIEYVYEKFSPAQYKSELLVLNGITIFDFNYSTDLYSYDNLNVISAETIVVERFLESKNEEGLEDSKEDPPLSFLRWLFANAAFPNDSPINEMRNYIYKMRIFSVSDLTRNRPRKNDTFFETLEGENLKKLEIFLNDMGVECQLESKKLPDGQNELYFKHNKLVPFFENASSGTMILFNIYRRVVTVMRNMSFCFFDEFDAFFHYEMSERFVKFFKEEFASCQIVFTTHNTNLMSNSLMRPDCIFILSKKGLLTSLNHATTRELREGHNLEKMYISGEFEDYE